MKAAKSSLWLLLSACLLGGQPAAAAGRRIPFDRAAIRYTSPETGGSSKPRFLFDRELAFLVRVEALREDGQLVGDWLDRHLRTTVERQIADEMLAALQVRSEEPRRLPDLVQRARRDLEEQVGGADRLLATMNAEGITEAELERLLRNRARAMTYVDQELTPFMQPSEDELYAAFRASVHPYRTQKYEDVRERFLRWYVNTRFFTLELDYLQGAKSRMSIVYL